MDKYDADKAGYLKRIAEALEGILASMKKQAELG